MINGTHIAAARRIEGLDEYYFSRKLAEVRALHTAAHPVINLASVTLTCHHHRK